MREAIVVQTQGHVLVGTMHTPRGQDAVVPGALGVLMLSFGQQPRSWVGDLGVVVADHVSDAGYRVFRFDMPGLGDSPGDVPVHLEVLWRSIQEGGHATVARALVGELKHRFALRGLIVGGFCGGAVTATFAIDPSNNDALGLFMLEPEIALTPTPEVRPMHEVDTVSSFLERVDLIKRRLRSPASWRRLFTGNSDLRYWKGLLDYAWKRRRASKQGENLPPDTNRGLLEAWAKFTGRGMPSLVISAGTPARRKYYNSYNLQPGRSDAAAHLTWHEIENTTHAMLAGGAKAAIPQQIEAWLRAHFPIANAPVVARGAGPVAAKSA
jgi:pimeloyl-ACP methyl ester carboxylesterase